MSARTGSPLAPSSPSPGPLPPCLECAWLLSELAPTPSTQMVPISAGDGGPPFLPADLQGDGDSPPVVFTDSRNAAPARSAATAARALAPLVALAPGFEGAAVRPGAVDRQQRRCRRRAAAARGRRPARGAALCGHQRAPAAAAGPDARVCADWRRWRGRALPRAAPAGRRGLQLCRPRGCMCPAQRSWPRP